MQSGLVRRGVVGLFCLFAWTVAALGADKPLFDYQAIVLDNGLKVITLEDFSCPIVAVQLWYHVGSKDERIERQGFAHMFEHMMFRGTDRLGPTDHFDYLRRSGGDCNAYTAFDQTVYHEIVPANQLELALWLEAERMAFLKIDQTSFDTERKVVEEERRLGVNRPYGTMLEKGLGELYKVHPYGWSPIGKIDHLRASAVQELRDFWLRYYVPNNATLVMVGAVKHAEAQKLAKKYFGWIPRDADPPRVTVREPPSAKARAVTIQEDNAPAPIVAVAWRTVPQGHDDHHLLELLGTIVGGGDSSRLYRHLVADKQLAVAAVGTAFAMEQEGLFFAAAFLSPLGGSTTKALAAVQQEIERVRTEPVSARELLKAKNQMLSGWLTQNTVNSKASLLGSAAVLEGDVSRVNRRLDQIKKATAADLLRVAKTYLTPERSLTATVERNLLGSILGRRSGDFKKEEASPITAKPETGPPPPIRPGLRRPAEFPEKPPVATVQNLKMNFPHTTKTLPNGLKVMVVPNNEVPYVSIWLGLRAGAWTESKPGTVSMAASMLTKGTAKHTEKELSEELETYAISLNGVGGMDATSVMAGCLSDYVDKTMTLLAEAVQTPTFPPEEFAKLRQQTLTSLAVSAAEPSYKAARELRRRLYGKHPYARTATGEVEDVNALQVEDLGMWWKTFARPDQAMLIFSGDILPEKAFQLTEATLGGWKGEGPQPEIKLPPLPLPAGKRIFLVDHPSGIQSQIRVGQLVNLKLDHPDYPTARVVSSYFGGAFNSRLNEVIRVKKGLTYGAGGGFAPARFAGEFDISTFSKTESTAEAVQAVFEELERLAKEPPTAKELSDTKAYYLGSFARARETPQDVAGELWSIELNGLPTDYFEKTLEKVAQTPAEACASLVRELIDPAKMVVVVVGNASQIHKDLEKIAPVTVVRPGKEAKEEADKEKK